MNYFNELQERIREIRLSERFFYQKIKLKNSNQFEFLSFQNGWILPEWEITKAFLTAKKLGEFRGAQNKLKQKSITLSLLQNTARIIYVEREGKGLGVYDFLKYLKEKGLNRTKSGIMLGLGETEEEVIQTLYDLKDAKVDVVTIGQYLQPSKKHLPVKEFITPEQFEKYERIGKELGFIHVESGPLVRSSYHAEKHIH